MSPWGLATPLVARKILRNWSLWRRMRPKRPDFWKISAQETREAKRRMARTTRATKPVCARISKMLPMKMARKRKMISVPHEKQIFTDKSNVAHGWNRVKGMRCKRMRKSSLG